MRQGTTEPKLINSIKIRVEFLLLHEGVSQTQAAHLLGISRKTIWQWNKKHKWTIKQKEKSEKVKFDDSLNAFIAFNTIRHPERKEDLNNWYNQFKNNI